MKKKLFVTFAILNALAVVFLTASMIVNANPVITLVNIPIILLNLHSFRLNLNAYRRSSN